MRYIFTFMMSLVLSIATAQMATKELSTKLDILTSPLDRLVIDSSIQVKNAVPQKATFNVDRLPIFCRIEHKLAKSSNVNVMMRLGSLDYVNKLEGKNK